MKRSILFETVFQSSTAALCLFLVSLPISSFAAPVPLPDWVKPIVSTLPKISPDLVSEVDDIFWFRALNNEYKDVTGKKAQIELNDLRLVELREQAGQAMIWQYFKWTTEGGSPRVLPILAKDRILAAWLLPILRYRIELFQEAIKNKRLPQFLKSMKNQPGAEISEIEVYLTYQGEYSDLENLNIVHHELFKLGRAFSDPTDPSTPELLAAQVQAMKIARELSDQQNQQYWQLVASLLIEDGVLKADALNPMPLAQSPEERTDSPKPLPPRKPLPESISPATPTTSNSAKPPFAGFSWFMRIIFGLGSVGILYWLYKKVRERFSS